MRKLFLFFCVTAFAIASQAQTAATGSYKKKPTLAVNFVLNDFKTAAAIKSQTLGTVLNDKTWSKLGQMSPGLGLQYLQGLTEYVDFSGNLQVTFVDYAVPGRPATASADGAFIEADAGVNVKLLTDRYFVTPYISAGLGASIYRGTYYAAHIPLGLGFQFNLGNRDAFLFTNLGYRIPVTNLAQHHFNYSIGFAAPLSGK